MTFRDLAFHNVFRNFRTYAAYFLSSAFSVMVFFVYATFAFHPKLTAETLKEASTGMHFAEAIIYVFTFFFILYSMSTFLKTRKKEFGILIMNGMADMQLKRLVFIENMVIGFLSTLIGIGAGFIFSQIILYSSSYLLDMDEPLPFYLPTNAALLTFVAFIVLFLFISLFTAAILRGNKLIDLLTGSEKPKPEPKASVFQSLLAAILLITGYTVALLVEGMGVVAAMIPVTVVVIIGTYFLFTQLSVWIITKLRKNEKIYLHKTNIVTFSDLAYRMKDNARMFFIVTIITTVAFSAIGSLVGFRSLMVNGAVKSDLYAFHYTSFSNNAKANEHQQKIENVLENNKIHYQQLDASFKNVSEKAKNEGEGSFFTVIKQSDYNKFAKATGANEITLKGKSAAVIPQYFSFNSDADRELFKRKVTLNENNQELRIETVLGQSVIPLRLLQGDGLIVTDSLYESIKAESNHYSAYDVNDLEKTEEIGEDLLASIPLTENGAYDFSSLAVKVNEVKQGINTILFVGLFIGVVFFVAAGSFLYFRLYSDLEEDSKKYLAITKLGITEKELKRVVTTQIALLFFVPVGVALVHGFVALIALGHMFNTTLWTEIAMVLGSFFLIQVIYFVFIRIRYIKNLKEAL
ncbi:FtsX-like permease family protein [Metabacillus arenae]|uniref:FtsX-like permease family protein n=1 Tax=Metabacillus arenae TaxID=2771434 RepID=A0A926NDD1_9BACI|nr:FtsX-like permease family protein [Metabacillus arenae]MBD1382192.1 FtsX-like permease family protein [Metabacillus arenae]